MGDVHPVHHNAKVGILHHLSQLVQSGAISLDVSRLLSEYLLENGVNVLTQHFQFFGSDVTTM